MRTSINLSYPIELGQFLLEHNEKLRVGWYIILGPLVVLCRSLYTFPEIAIFAKKLTNPVNFEKSEDQLTLWNSLVNIGLKVLDPKYSPAVFETSRLNQLIIEINIKSKFLPTPKLKFF